MRTRHLPWLDLEPLPIPRPSLAHLTRAYARRIWTFLRIWRVAWEMDLLAGQEDALERVAWLARRRWVLEGELGR